ncbi:MAG: hypothetical protein Q7S14_02850 [bacterium]|nr:hypothetical protein [bacterium]
MKYEDWAEANDHIVGHWEHGRQVVLDNSHVGELGYGERGPTQIVSSEKIIGKDGSPVSRIDTLVTGERVTTVLDLNTYYDPNLRPQGEHGMSSRSVVGFNPQSIRGSMANEAMLSTDRSVGYQATYFDLSGRPISCSRDGDGTVTTKWADGKTIKYDVNGMVGVNNKNRGGCFLFGLLSLIVR